MDRNKLSTDMRAAADRFEAQFTLTNALEGVAREVGFAVLVGQMQGTLRNFAIEAEYLREVA